MSVQLRSILAQPVNRLLVLSFVIVSLIPLSVLGVKLYNAAWENAWREIHEKHRLLAMNLASPINIYVTDKRRMLGVLSTTVASTLRQGKDYRKVQKTLQTAREYLVDFNLIALVHSDGTTRALLQLNPQGKPVPGKWKTLFAGDETFRKTRETGKWSFSGVQRSRVSGNPTAIMTQPVSVDDRTAYVLLAELRLDEIERLRRNIHFGERGHSAIVDNYGRVVAHPNPDWMKQIKDLSHLDVVKKMLAGETGVTEFYSPFVKLDMVAGYTGVPGLGWGIMVPQPKNEVEKQVHQLLFSHLGWALLGLTVAIVLAILLARWITQPIDRLSGAAAALITDKFDGTLPETSRFAPREVRDLGRALADLVTTFQSTRKEINELNVSLRSRVEEATRQLSEANTRLAETAAQAEQASTAKSLFLANMSHELRTPLNAIIGYTQLLHEEAVDAGNDKLLPDLEKVEISAQRLLSLVKDILDLSKIEAGKMELDLETFNVCPLVEEVKTEIHPLIKKNHNRFQVNCDADIGSMHTDAGKLRQMLLNLLSNSSKFTENGEIYLDVEREKKDGMEYVLFSVRDTGIGMTPEQVEKVFYAFSQAEISTTRKYGGTGLGLSISRYFCRLMGGDISVKSAPGAGSTFVITLTAQVAPAVS